MPVTATFRPLNRETPNHRPSRSLAVGGVVLIALSLMSLVGHLTGWSMLAALGPDAAPMALPTALTMLSCGVSLLAHSADSRRLALLTAAVTALAGGIVLVIYVMAGP